MKKHLMRAATVAIALALPFSAAGQGRHDEKPHATGKPAAATTDQTRSATTSGRHDEGPTSHRARKSKTNKKVSKTRE